MTTTLHSRIAAAAVIAPLAVLAVGCGSDSGDNSNDAASDPTTTASSDPALPTGEPTTTPTTSEPTEPTPTEPGGVDYVVDGVWHQADGDVVQLPKSDQAYDAAVLWNDQLVATRWDGEVFSIADVIDAEGNVVETFETTSGVSVNEAGTTIAWVSTEGEVMTAWDGGQVSMGTVDLAAPGETVAYFTAAITGGPNCHEDQDGCMVFVNSGLGEPRTFDSHGVNDNPLPFVIDFNDVSGDHLVTYVDQIEDDGSCGGLVDLTRTDNRPEWKTCENEPAQISPDSKHVIGLPSYYDGLGITEISVLDATTGDETGRYAPEGGFISQWAWATDGNVVFDTYDGAQWHLMTMAPDGETTEIGEPAQGEEFDSPFTLIQH